MKKILIPMALLFTLACSDDEVKPSCESMQKADIQTTSLLVEQQDDHHFTVKATIRNNAFGECAETSVQTDVKLKVFYAASGPATADSELLYDRTLTVGALEPVKSANIFEVVNFDENGSYFIQLTLDTTNKVDEANEGNNVREQRVSRNN